MGNTLTGEYPSTWDEPEVKDWKNTAAGQQQCAYLQFGGAQFHDITGLSKALRVTKVSMLFIRETRCFMNKNSMTLLHFSYFDQGAPMIHLRDTPSLISI